jgi:hypothetical protein
MAARNPPPASRYRLSSFVALERRLGTRAYRCRTTE